MDGIVMVGFKRSLCLAALCLFPSQSAQAYDETSFCTEMQEVAKTHSAKKGAWVDYRTKSGEMIVTCKGKRIVSKQSVQAPENGLKDDALQKIQTEWNDNFCPDEHFRDAIKNGWVMVMNLSFTDGKTHDITAICQ